MQLEPCIRAAAVMVQLGCSRSAAYEHLRRAARRAEGARGLLAVPVSMWNRYVERITSGAQEPATPERWRRPKRPARSLPGVSGVYFVRAGMNGPRAEHRRCVALWHSHHEAALGERFALRAVVASATVAVVVVGDPVAPELRAVGAWEVTRLAVGPDAPHCTASRLLGAAWRQMRIYDVRRAVSYTRIDEDGTCYRAAGWVPVARVRGRDHDTGNRRGRYLPGVDMRSTETIDRIRWEIGPDAECTRVEARPAPLEVAS